MFLHLSPNRPDVSFPDQLSVQYIYSNVPVGKLNVPSQIPSPSASVNARFPHDQPSEGPV